ncbi:hypothetical protein [Flexistipes sp.]|uniref:hypothetical protein n=1 Tax=Flexistipes sp. TaxID=3088135 RepID=UPI002E231F2B|nr:hypothetical protein [Flexistipes sp.]
MKKTKFIQSLGEINEKTNISEIFYDYFTKQSKELNSQVKFHVIVNLFEGSENNPVFIKEIIKNEKENILENLNTFLETSIIEKTESDEAIDLDVLKRITEFMLLKNVEIPEALSENTIESINGIYGEVPKKGLLNGVNQNNIHSKPDVDKLIQNKSLLQLFFIHSINISSKFKETTQIHDIIGFYCFLLNRNLIEISNDMLIPLSLISILWNYTNENFRYNNNISVSTNEIFRYLDLKNANFKEYLIIIQHANKEYEFLLILAETEDLKEYKNYILYSMLENGVHENYLIDFCDLFITYSSEKFSEAVVAKTKEQEDWYKNYVLKYLERDDNDNIVKFINFLESENLQWHKNKDILNKLVKFSKNLLLSGIEKLILEKGRSSELELVLNTSHYKKLSISYSHGDVGSDLIEIFIRLENEEDEYLLKATKEIFGNIERIFSKPSLKDTFVPKLIKRIINDTDNINKTQKDLIVQLKNINVEESIVRDYFNKILDIDNVYDYQIFKHLLKNTNLDKNDLKHFQEEFKTKQDNKELDDELLEIIDETLKILGNKLN